MHRIKASSADADELVSAFNDKKIKKILVVVNPSQLEKAGALQNLETHYPKINS